MGEPEDGGQIRGLTLTPTGLNFTRAIIYGSCAVAVAVVASAFGNVKSSALDRKLVAYLGTVVFVILAVMAVRSVAKTVSSALAARGGKAGEGSVKVLISLAGYLVILLTALGLLDVPAERLLIGGAITGVVVGIAAQQALGNVFAGLVLLAARPFSVHERVKIRSGSLGGPFVGVVTSMSLTYTTLQTDEGLIHLPNSVLLASGIGPAPPDEPTSSELADDRPRLPPPDPSDRLPHGDVPSGTP